MLFVDLFVCPSIIKRVLFGFCFQKTLGQFVAKGSLDIPPFFIECLLSVFDKSLWRFSCYNRHFTILLSSLYLLTVTQTDTFRQKSSFPLYKVCHLKSSCSCDLSTSLLPPILLSSLCCQNSLSSLHPYPKTKGKLH